MIFIKINVNKSLPVYVRATVKNDGLKLHIFNGSGSKLAHPDDIKKDLYGKWLHSGSHTDVFICTYSEDDKCQH